MGCEVLATSNHDRRPDPLPPKRRDLLWRAAWRHEFSGDFAGRQHLGNGIGLPPSVALGRENGTTSKLYQNPRREFALIRRGRSNLGVRERLGERIDIGFGPRNRPRGGFIERSFSESKDGVLGRRFLSDGGDCFLDAGQAKSPRAECRVDCEVIAKRSETTTLRLCPRRWLRGLALPVAGVLIRRASYAHRLAAAIDVLAADPAEKAVLKNFVAQAVVSPRCARLLEHLDLQFLRDDKTKKFVMTNILANLVFRSRYTDRRGRGREVFVFRVKYSVSSRAGLQTVVITDDWGRVLTWKELGETIYFDSADLERAGDRNILAIYNEQAGYRSIYRSDLADDEIRPIRVEPFPSRKIMDALAKINHISMDVSLNPKLGNTVNFNGGTQTDDELAALADTLDVLGGVKTLYLARSRITGAGLVHLKSLSSLKELDLHETAVDDAGLALLSSLVNLETLDLSNTKVVGPGLKALRGLRKLKVLKLKGCPIKDKDLQPLKGLPNLKHIVLDAAPR